MCVCVREREGGEGEREKDRERERVDACRQIMREKKKEWMNRDKRGWAIGYVVLGGGGRGCEDSEDIERGRVGERQGVSKKRNRSTR